MGQAAKDSLSAFTGTTGSITTLLASITTQNKNLGSQILTAQARLDREKEVLRKKFAQMEAVVGQMKSSAGSLSGA